jgi:hypothetical protein
MLKFSPSLGEASSRAWDENHSWTIDANLQEQFKQALASKVAAAPINTATTDDDKNTITKNIISALTTLMNYLYRNSTVGRPCRFCGKVVIVDVDDGLPKLLQQGLPIHFSCKEPLPQTNVEGWATSSVPIADLDRLRDLTPLAAAAD